MFSELITRIQEEVAGLDPLTLPSVTLKDRGDLPTTAGLYFLVHAGLNVLYIGKAISLRGRWINHNRTKRANQLGHVRIHFLETSNPSTFEVPFIEHHTPPWNKTDNPGYDPTHPYLSVRRYRKWAKTQPELLVTLATLPEHEIEDFEKGISEGLMTRKQAAKIAGVEHVTIHSWVTDGKIQMDPITKHVIQESLEAYLKTREIPEGLVTAQQAAKIAEVTVGGIHKWAKLGYIQRDPVHNLITLESLEAHLKIRGVIPKGMETVKQAAKIAGVTTSTIHNWAKDGIIQRDPTTNLIILESLEAHLKTRGELPEGLATRKQAAEIAGVSPSTIRDWVKAGKIQRDPTTKGIILKSLRDYLAS